MLSYKEIEVPDIGDFRSVPVVEILVQEGERVEVDTPLITVKTEKGPMDVPSPLAGKVQELIVHAEDRVTRGSSILLLETEVEDPVSTPSRAESEPDVRLEPEVETTQDDDVDPVWEVDPIIDPTTTEPRLPTDDDWDEPAADEALLSEADRIDDDVATLENEVSPPPHEEDADDPDEPPTQQGESELEPADAQNLTPQHNPDQVTTSDTDAADPGGQTVLVPDIGDFSDVEVIEILVSVGSEVNLEDPLITLESDKAAMDVPATLAGVVTEVLVDVGDVVSEGSEIVRIGGSADSTPAQPETPVVSAPAEPEPVEDPESEPEPEPQLQTESVEADDKPAAPDHSTVNAIPASEIELPPPGTPRASQQTASRKDAAGDENPHASPGVRKFARELGVDLTKVTGKGPKGRILKEDVQRWVKSTLSKQPTSTPAVPETAGAGIPEIPEIDFSQFGEIETQPLSRIKKLTATNLSRAWLNVPHVTQHDEADITELEEFRKALKKEEEAKTGARITMLSFMMKACVVALKEFPVFNSSLEKGGENLILKRYYHIGIAVDTEEGLVVPVVKDVDRKSIRDLAGELGDISSRARERKLSPKDLQGASFTISSLGGIGGVAFTPIVNAPEVAILGVSRSSMKPVYEDGEFVPRLILPLSLSYDHRVIDGAQAARFTTFLATVLGDVRRLLL